MVSTMDDIFAGIGKKGSAVNGKSAPKTNEDQSGKSEKDGSNDVPSMTKNQKKKLKQKNKKSEGAASKTQEGITDAPAQLTKSESPKKEVVVVDGTKKRKAKREGERSDMAKRSKADDLLFGDTKGTGSSRQKTEDGYTVYKEDDLKLSNTGGGTRFASRHPFWRINVASLDTADCPFDCSCCY